MNGKTIVAPRPAEAPEGWRIYAAPHPLYGTRSWQGDDGEYIVAVDPASPHAYEMHNANGALDATRLHYEMED